MQMAHYKLTIIIIIIINHSYLIQYPNVDSPISNSSAESEYIVSSSSLFHRLTTLVLM